MFEGLSDFVEGRYAPHGRGLPGDPWLPWTMAVSDGLIALACFSIAISLVAAVRRRPDDASGRALRLLALLIAACGLSPMVGLWPWNGAGVVTAIVKPIVAAVSIAVAILLWRRPPGAVGATLLEHLHEENRALRAEIAERKRTESALIQARKMEAMGQLTGGIAHDFNNLLQVVSGSLDLIAARTAGDERVQHLTSAAMAAVDRGRRLTSQLLSFARIQRVELRPVRIADIVAGLRDLLTRTIDSSVAQRFEIDEAAHAVLADPVQLELALLNLALNARDAMPGGGRLTLTVRNEQLAGHDDVEDGDYVGITVSDSGAGMGADVIARAFEPFFTTKPVGRGSGLGLSMVFGMARQSGGMVTIDSTVGRGTSVTIFLRSADGAAAIEKPSRAAGQNAPRRLDGHRILVVDDEPIVREVVADMLGELGCKVITAENGLKALELVDSDAPDALLLDFTMPGMNGAEVARAVLARRPETRIVFATGFAQSEAIDAAVGDQAIMLRKPFSPRQLADALLRALA